MIKVFPIYRIVGMQFDKPEPESQRQLSLYGRLDENGGGWLDLDTVPDFDDIEDEPNEEAA